MIAIKEQIRSEVDQIIYLLEADMLENMQQRILLQLSSERVVLAKQFSLEIKEVLDQMGIEAEKEFIKQQKLYVAESLREADDKLVKLVKAILDRLTTLGFVATFQKKYGGFYKVVTTVTGQTISSGLGLTFNVPDEMARKIIEEGGKRVGLLDLLDGIKSKLFELIRQARSEGKGPDEIARRIRDEIPAGPWSSTQIRADVIAKTETKYAQNMATIENYKASGYITSLQAFDNLIGYHNSLPGSRVNDGCVVRDRKIFTFEQAEDETRKEHPNGTLIWAPYVRSEELVVDFGEYGQIGFERSLPEISQRNGVNSLTMANLKGSLENLSPAFKSKVKDIIIDANTGPKFTVGGKTFTTGADWTEALGRLRLFDANRYTGSTQLDAHLIHEITHSINRYIPYKLKEAFREATLREGGVTDYSRAWLKANPYRGYNENLSDAMSLLVNKNVKGETLSEIDRTRPKTMALVRLIWKAFGGRE